MYADLKSCVTNNNETSEFFKCNIGVRQGENLSPLLFALYLNDFEIFIKDRFNGVDLLPQNMKELMFDKGIDVPFGDQFWALSSIIQCTAIQPNVPGKIYLYTVATYSQHYKTLTIFTSRAVFAILRPISVALSRHQFWAVLTQ